MRGDRCAKKRSPRRPLEPTRGLERRRSTVTGLFPLLIRGRDPAVRSGPTGFCRWPPVERVSILVLCDRLCRSHGVRGSIRLSGVPLAENERACPPRKRQAGRMRTTPLSAGGAGTLSPCGAMLYPRQGATAGAVHENVDRQSPRLYSATGSAPEVGAACQGYCGPRN